MGDRLALCYHAVSANWPAALAVTPARFESQLNWLAGRGYRGVTFRELVAEHSEEKRLAVTFDDGFWSVMAKALPALERLGWPATIFVPPAFMNGAEALRWQGVEHWGDTAHGHELAPLSWTELRLLAERGWEIGSHTLSHPRLTGLDDDALREELRASRLACEGQLRQECASVAYPYGDVDGRVVAAAAAAGYVAAAALGNPRLAPVSLAFPRVGVYRADHDTRFRVKVSGSVRLAQRMPVWPLAKKAHRSLTEWFGKRSD